MCPQKSAIFFPKKVEGYLNLFQRTIKFCTDRPIKLQGPRCFTHKHQLNNSTSQEVEEDEKLKGFHASLADSERGNIPGFPETPGNRCSMRHQMSFNSFYQRNTIVHSIMVNLTCELASLHWSNCQALISTFLKHNFQAAADRHAHFHFSIFPFTFTNLISLKLFRSQLTDTLTSIIFTGSVQHQAINAPQFTYSFQPHRPVILTK